MAMKHSSRPRWLLQRRPKVEELNASARPQRFLGQSVVEFSLVSLLLMTLVAGVVDLGRGVYTRTTVSNAVREAARYGATDPTNSDGIISAANRRSAGVTLAQDNDRVQSFANNGGVIRCTDRNFAWLPPCMQTKCLPPPHLALVSSFRQWGNSSSTPRRASASAVLSSRSTVAARIPPTNCQQAGFRAAR